jgi:hypothetical protein
MAFCTKCGASVEGDFCTKCGTQIGSPGATSTQAEQFGQSIPPPSPEAKKKGRTVFWILGGCIVLVIVASIILLTGGYFLARKVGLDPALMKSDPTLAVAKMMATVNPDVEVLSVDEDKGLIRMREKKTGKTMTMNLKDAQKGKFVFQDDKEGNIEIQAKGEGDNASVEVRSDKGTMRMGAGSKADLPDWLPAYRGAESAGVFSLSGEDSNAGSCTFKTSDSVENVASFYENALKQAGFTVQKTTTQVPGKGSFIMLMAEDSSNRRTANVTAAKSEEGTTITMTFETKK